MQNWLLLLNLIGKGPRSSWARCRICPNPFSIIVFFLPLIFFFFFIYFFPFFFTSPQHYCSFTFFSGCKTQNGTSLGQITGANHIRSRFNNHYYFFSNSLVLHLHKLINITSWENLVRNSSTGSTHCSN